LCGIRHQFTVKLRDSTLVPKLDESHAARWNEKQNLIHLWFVHGKE